MGLFSSSKGLTQAKIERALSKISIINAQERAYILGLFANYRHGGISKQEIEKAVKELKVNTSDHIDRNEAEAVRKALLELIS